MVGRLQHVHSLLRRFCFALIPQRFQIRCRCRHVRIVDAIGSDVVWETPSLERQSGIYKNDIFINCMYINIYK